MIWVRNLFVLSAVVLAGCSSDPGPKADLEKVVRVSGTLTYQGKALEQYQVTLLPTDGRRPALGVTDGSGNFTMGTNGADDGAPPGIHKLAVVWSPPASDDGGNEAIIDDPSKLPKPTVKIPAKYENPETSGRTVEIPEDGVTDLKIELD